MKKSSWVLGILMIVFGSCAVSASAQKSMIDEDNIYLFADMGGGVACYGGKAIGGKNLPVRVKEIAVGEVAVVIKPAEKKRRLETMRNRIAKLRERASERLSRGLARGQASGKLATLLENLKDYIQAFADCRVFEAPANPALDDGDEDESDGDFGDDNADVGNGGGSNGGDNSGNQSGGGVEPTPTPAPTATPTPAPAGFSQNVLVITASNSKGSVEMQIDWSQGEYNESTKLLHWKLASPLKLIDSTNKVEIGTLVAVDVSARRGGSVMRHKLDFSVLGGSEETTFILTSNLFSFDTIVSSLSKGAGKGSLYAKDLNNDGVSVTALGGKGNGIFHLQYNGAYPDGANFANFLSVYSGGPGSSGSVSQQDPAFGFRSVGGDVSKLHVHAAFKASAGDQIEGSTKFEVKSAS